MSGYDLTDTEELDYGIKGNLINYPLLYLNSHHLTSYSSFM